MLARPSGVRAPRTEGWRRQESAQLGQKAGAGTECYGVDRVRTLGQKAGTERGERLRARTLGRKAGAAAERSTLAPSLEPPLRGW